MKRIMAILLSASILVSGLVVSANAEEAAQTVSAEIMPVKDGAKGILTMTFDDGDYNTAVWLDSEFAKYGLSGSCMLIVGRNVGYSYDPESLTGKNWAEVFSHGRLEPQSHSMTHDIMPTEGWATNNNNLSAMNNNYAAKYKYELVDSKRLLEQYFPDEYPICMAPSNNTLSTWSYTAKGSGQRVEDGGALKVARENYYAIRQGSRGLQDFSPVADGEGPGSWRDLYMHRFSDVSTVSGATAWIDGAISQGKWVITLCHGITATSGDFNQAQADEFFAYASEKVASGDLWCADFSTATRYLRERQNSTVSATATADGMTVKMTMAETTADGLPLTASIFNYPLTVKVEVPNKNSLLAYSCEGVNRYAESFAENGKYYAYLDVVPNTETRVSYRYERTQELAPDTVLTVTSDGATLSDTLLVSAHADTVNPDRETKVYTKISLAGVTASDKIWFPLSVTGDVSGTVRLYGSTDTSWDASTPAADLPAGDPFGFGVLTSEVFGNAPLATLNVTGEGDYPADISAFARAAVAEGKSEITVILTLVSGTQKTEMPLSFTRITKIEGYDNSYDFEKNDGGLVTAGIDNGAIEAVDGTDNHTAQGGKALHLLMSKNYQRVYLKKLLNETDTISVNDLGKVYQVTFFAKLNKAGKIQVATSDFVSRPGSGDQMKTITVAASNVGKWVEYSYSFTVSQTMLDKTYTGLYFALRCDNQSPDNPIEGWIDDITVTGADPAAKIADVALTTGNGLMTDPTVTEPGIHKALVGYDGVTGLRALTFGFALPETLSGKVSVYLSGEKLTSSATYAASPAASVPETPDLSRVLGGAPVYEAQTGGAHTFSLFGSSVANFDDLTFLFVSSDIKDAVAVSGVSLKAKRATDENGFTLTFANGKDIAPCTGFDIELPTGATFYLAADGTLYEAGEEISIEENTVLTAINLILSDTPVFSADKRQATLTAQFDSVSKEKLASLGGTLSVFASVGNAAPAAMTKAGDAYTVSFPVNAGQTVSVSASAVFQKDGKTVTGDAVGNPVTVLNRGFRLSFSNSTISDKYGFDVELPGGLFTDGNGKFYGGGETVTLTADTELIQINFVQQKGAAISLTGDMKLRYEFAFDSVSASLLAKAGAQVSYSASVNLGKITPTVEEKNGVQYASFPVEAGTRYAMTSTATVTVGAKTFTLKSNLQMTDNTRKPEDVANAAYLDRADVKSADYPYLTADNDYSPYSTASLNVLKQLKGK